MASNHCLNLIAWRFKQSITKNRGWNIGIIRALLRRKIDFILLMWGLMTVTRPRETEITQSQSNNQDLRKNLRWIAKSRYLMLQSSPSQMFAEVQATHLQFYLKRWCSCKNFKVKCWYTCWIYLWFPQWIYVNRDF